MTLFMLAAYGFICAAVYHLCPAQIRWAVLLLAFGPMEGKISVEAIDKMIKEE